MAVRNAGLVFLALTCCVSIGAAVPARAESNAIRQYDVVLNTPIWTGKKARVVFALTDGDAGADSFAAVSEFETNGTIGAGPVSFEKRGNVLGDLSDVLSFDDRAGMVNQFTQKDVVLGTRIAFPVKTSDVHAAPDRLHDTFTFHLLDANANTPLVVSDDPTSANAVFMIELGKPEAEQLTRFQRGFGQSTCCSWSATVTSVPEPAGIASALTALGALAACKRRIRR